MKLSLGRVYVPSHLCTTEGRLRDTGLWIELKLGEAAETHSAESSGLVPWGVPSLLRDRGL